MKSLLVLMMLAPGLAVAGESFMDINPEDLGCVGDAPETKYHQRCVAGCVVNGVGGYSYMGKFQDMSDGTIGEFYNLGGEYKCPQPITGEVGRVLFQDARQVAQEVCGPGNLLKVITMGMNGSGVHGVVACKEAMRYTPPDKAN